MAFGQQSGPPATGRQLKELADLLAGAGYATFREARHPMGLSQRQAGGRFTREEADELIGRLGSDEADATDAPAADVASTPRATAASQVLRVLPSEQLAFELERRGWTVIPPT